MVFNYEFGNLLEIRKKEAVRLRYDCNRCVVQHLTPSEDFSRCKQHIL